MCKKTKQNKIKLKATIGKGEARRERVFVVEGTVTLKLEVSSVYRGQVGGGV